MQSSNFYDIQILLKFYIGSSNAGGGGGCGGGGIWYIYFNFSTQALYSQNLAAVSA